jgi:hypothetical protein
MGQAKKEVGLGRSKKLGESRAKLLNMLAEGVNFREMIASKDQSLTELLSELQADIAEFKETGHCSDFLRDCMEVHGYGKKQLTDAVRGDSFAPQHPGTPAPQSSFLDKAKAFGHKVLDKVGHGSDEELKAKLRRDMGMQEAAELNELARLAGLEIKESAGFASHELESKIRARLEQLHDTEQYEPEDVYDMVAAEFGMSQEELQAALAADDVDEGNDGNLANNAKPYDKVTRGDVIAGRLGKDEMGVEEGNDGNLANNAKPYDKVTRGDVIAGRLGKDEEGNKVDESALSECGDMSPIGSMAHEMQQQQGRISVNTNSSSDGNKNVTISSEGEAAEQLMAMLKMAGLGGGKAHAQQAEIVIAHEAKEYGDTEVEEPEDEPSKEKLPKDEPKKRQRKFKNVELVECPKCNKQRTKRTLRYDHDKPCKGEKIIKETQQVKRRAPQVNINQNVVGMLI